MISSVNRIIRKTKRFSRDIKKMSFPVQEDAYQIVKKLKSNIFHPELNVRELTGFKGNYRVVVLKDYRMIFSFDAVNLLRIGHRKDIYRKLEL